MSIIKIQPAAGELNPSDWLNISSQARSNADGYVYLTRHSGVEFRDVLSPLSDSVLELDCSPVVASPLSDLARDLARELARELALPTAATVGIDSGCRDLEQLELSLYAVLNDDGKSADIYRLGTRVATAIALDKLAKTLITHAKDLPCPAANLRSKDYPHHLLGWIQNPVDPQQVSLGAALVGGAMHADYAEMIGRMEVNTTVTAWGGLVFHNLKEEDADVVLRFLAPRGFIFDADSPLLG